MLAYITSSNRDEIFAASLIHLMSTSGDPRLRPVLIKASQDTSPLIRAAAVEALQGFPGEDALEALVRATGASVRLVRIRATASLAGFPEIPMSDGEKKHVEAATREYLDSMLARPDLWSSHYNLGNYYLLRGEYGKAVSNYDTAIQKEPGAVLAMVNKSIALARMGNAENAHEVLKAALERDPQNAVVNFNLALSEAQAGYLGTAEKTPQNGLRSRSSNGRGRLQSVRTVVEGPHERGHFLLQKSNDTSARPAALCVHPCLLSDRKRGCWRRLKHSDKTD